MEARELKAKGPWMPRVLVGLAVSTLALGLAMLAIVSKLDVNGVEDVPPHMALSHDGQEGELKILQADPGLRWSDLRLDGDCALVINGAPLMETPQAQVMAGDMLSCGPGEALQIFSTRDRGNVILYEGTFAEDVE